MQDERKRKNGDAGVNHLYGRYGSHELGADSCVFGGQRREVYGWVEATLVWHQHAAGNGLLRRYLCRIPRWFASDHPVR